MKQPVYPLYVPQDEQAVRPVLDALKQKGVTVREAGEPKRGDAVVFFLSEHVAEDSPAAAQFFAIQSRTATLIPVMLDGSTPPELIRNALLARHSIAAERYDADELSERIASALKKKNPLPWIIGIAALAAVLVAGAILLIRAIGKTPDTPAATVEPTEVPEPTPVPRVPSEAGIKPEDLARVYQLFIIGDRMEVLYGDEGYAARFGYAKIDATNYANRFDDENGSHWTDNTTGEEILLHTWEDLDFLRYMTNLKFLDVILVEGTLPDLKELTNLDYVHIDSCKLDSLNGLAGCRFTTLEYRSEAMDFSPLSDCPRLRNVSLGLEGDLPDDLDTFGPPTVLELNLYVSGAPKIRTLSGLSACRGLSDVTLNNLLIRDLTCLEHATKLSSLNLNDLHDLTSMNGMMEHRNMTDLTIDNCEALIDLNALIACPNLKDVHLFDLRTEDLFFLSGATGISNLEVRYSDTIRSAHGLENHMTLKYLNFEGLHRLTDVSALSGCTSLDHVCIMDSHNLIDVSPIVGLPKLYKLELYGAGPDHVNYLSDIVNKNYFSFGVAEVHDWSGLLAIRRYNWLNITDHNGSALPYLQDAMIDRFELWYRSDYNNGSDSPIDYSVFPTVYDQLTLHGVPSLVGLPASNVTSIRIDNSDFLTSLDGFQNLNRLRDDAIVDLYVGECPRLTDWSALNGVSLSRLEISGMFTLPDFGTFSVRRIRLESIVDLTDLAPLAALNPDKRYDEIALFDVDGVTDLSPLYRLKGNKLSVPAHLGQQAALLQESGNFTQIEIEYPDYWWQPYEPYVKLLSLEEIDTLPSAMLRYVQDLNIVGDRLFNWDEYDVEQDWSTGYPVTTYLVNRETGERELIEYGSMTDLSRLSVLTGLKNLNIQNVGLTSLEGIQYLGSLEHLWVFNCADLTDASAAFTMQNLRELMINDCHGITSIEGVQNLMNLEHLELRSTDVESIAGVEALSKLRYFDLQYTLVTDLSPLGALSDDCEILFDMDGITVQDFLSLPDSVLAKVQRLCIAGDWIYNGNNWWFDADWSSNGTVGILQSSYSDQRTPIGQGSVADLSFLSRMPNLREFQFAFNPIESLDGIEALTQLEFVRIRLCPKITDVSLLFTMPSLYEIDVSNLPITSVAGIEALPHLVNLRLGSTQVTDLSPLAMLDTTEAALNWSGFNLSIDNLSDVLDPEQYQVLAAFPTFWNLNVFNTDCSLWLDAVRNVQICELHAGNCSFTPETLKQLVEQHPELTYIKLSWTTGLTDISALLTAPNLERVCVSNNMQEAIESLGEALPFGLDIE